MQVENVISTKNITTNKWIGTSCETFNDVVSVEEPLEISIVYGKERTRKNISVTMRTPGRDAELALGFLFTEGILTSYDEVKNVIADNHSNVVVVEMAESFIPNLGKTDRNFYTTSSCGVCGKSSLDAIKTVSRFKNLPKLPIELSPETIYQLPKRLREAQADFQNTGGIHASGIFTIESELLALREDVGRHNALDKLIGYALGADLLPLHRHILLLSGRASFELVQKAAMAGISIIVAIGAPSSLAIELAKDFDITLLGFLKEKSFNCYHQSKSTIL